MSEIDHESESQARPWWRQPVIGSCCLLGIAGVGAITTVLPETATPVSVVIAGLGLLAAVAKH